MNPLLWSVLHIHITIYRHITPEDLLVVWDVQTGVVIKTIYTPHHFSDKITFHGDQRTITRITGSTFYTYGVLDGAQVCNGELLQSWDPRLGAHWVHGNTLRFATSFKADGELVINILELQPTATPPLPVVKSFPVLPCDGRFSFSSVSFHASFVSWEEVIILDVRDSKILLQTRVHLYDLSGEPRGHFSPDGSLFTCATSLYDIRIWKKTPTGYAPWRSLTPRSGISRFSFSPTAVLFLTWSREGIQLLLPDNFVNPSPPNMVELNCRRAEHLVAYSVDGSRIATVRQDDSVVTVLDALSGSPQQSINTNMRIRDVKIANNTIFVVNEENIASWYLEAGETVDVARGRTETAVLCSGVDMRLIALSKDCSQIAFTRRTTVVLYDVKTQEVLDQREAEGGVERIWFSPDGHKLRFIVRRLYKKPAFLKGRKRLSLEYPKLDRKSPRPPTAYFLIGLELTESLRFGKEYTRFLTERSSYAGVFSGSRGVSDWVTGSRDAKLLWLPPNLRGNDNLGVRWEGNFLALVGSRHPEPIIIRFQQ